MWFSGDEADVQKLFENASSSRLRSVFSGNGTIIIDEAQRIPNIGIVLKLINDQLKDIRIRATGSSSFELANRTKEPLTGRK